MSASSSTDDEMPALVSSESVQSLRDLIDEVNDQDANLARLKEGQIRQIAQEVRRALDSGLRTTAVYFQVIPSVVAVFPAYKFVNSLNHTSILIPVAGLEIPTPDEHDKAWENAIATCPTVPQVQPQFPPV